MILAVPIRMEKKKKKSAVRSDLEKITFQGTGTISMTLTLLFMTYHYSNTETDEERGGERSR